MRKYFIQQYHVDCIRGRAHNYQVKKIVFNLFVQFYQGQDISTNSQNIKWSITSNSNTDFIHKTYDNYRNQSIFYFQTQKFYQNLSLWRYLSLKVCNMSIINLNKTQLNTNTMDYYSFPSMFQNWLYANCMVGYSLENVQLPSDSTPQQSPMSPLNCQQDSKTRSRKGSQELICEKPQLKICDANKMKLTVDEDYNPEENNKKKGRKNKQDQNRNVIPNTIHQILSFLQKKSKSQIFVKKIFGKYEHPQQWTIKRFYLYQLKLKESLNHYVNEDTLNLLNILHEPQCAVYSEAEQWFYLKVCRILIHHFLGNQAPAIVLTSKRMSNDKKRDHLGARRVIEDKLLEIYRK